MGERILALIRAGAWPETAACSVGVDVRTLRLWLKRGAKASEKSVRWQEERAFLEDFRKAVAQSEVRLLTLVSKGAGEGVISAAQWLLERRFPERWAKREYIGEAEAVDTKGELVAQILADDIARGIANELVGRLYHTRKMLPGGNGRGTEQGGMASGSAPDLN